MQICKFAKILDISKFYLKKKIEYRLKVILSCSYNSNFSSFRLKTKPFIHFKELYIFSNNGNIWWRPRLPDTFCRQSTKDHQAKFGVVYTMVSENNIFKWFVFKISLICIFSLQISNTKISSATIVQMSSHLVIKCGFIWYVGVS